jgi:hypothetical protein
MSARMLEEWRIGEDLQGNSHSMTGVLPRNLSGRTDNKTIAFCDFANASETNRRQDNRCRCLILIWTLWYKSGPPCCTNLRGVLRMSPGLSANILAKFSCYLHPKTLFFPSPKSIYTAMLTNFWNCSSIFRYNLHTFHVNKCKGLQTWPYFGIQTRFLNFLDRKEVILSYHLLILKKLFLP